MKTWLRSILCRLGLHRRYSFLYENEELPGPRWRVVRCLWCDEVFVFELLPTEHPNCRCRIIEEE
jgi:hypothetical protein